jgi:hypothetical protein
MSVMVEERRRWKRVDIVDVPMSLTCRRVGWDADPLTVAGVNLSPGGIRFIAPPDFATGDVLDIDVGAGSIRVRVRGMVVYTSRDDLGCRHAHVAFTGLGDSALQTLATLVTAANAARAALRRPDTASAAG